VPTGGRDFGLVWSVGADISGVYCTPQTQLTTSSNLVVSVACSALSGGSFSGPPFTSEGGRESCNGFGSAAVLPCMATAGAFSAGLAVRSGVALDCCQTRANSSGEQSARRCAVSPGCNPGTTTRVFPAHQSRRRRLARSKHSSRSRPFERFDIARPIRRRQNYTRDRDSRAVG
jgi:hypothetical protein